MEQCSNLDCIWETSMYFASTKSRGLALAVSVPSPQFLNLIVRCILHQDISLHVNPEPLIIECTPVRMPTQWSLPPTVISWMLWWVSDGGHKHLVCSWFHRLLKTIRKQVIHDTKSYIFLRELFFCPWIAKVPEMNFERSSEMIRYGFYSVM